MNTLHNGKASIEKNMNGLKIIIPSKKNWFTLIFTTFWMGGWFMGFSFASTTLFSGAINGTGADWFLLFWLLAWTTGGMFALFTILWGFFGKEVIHFNGKELVLRKQILGIGIKEEMDKAYVKNFRFNQIEENYGIFTRRSTWETYGLGEGKIKMDYGMKTYSFGLGLDDSEANYLVQQMEDLISS